MNINNYVLINIIMPEYECENCGKRFDKKSNYIRHINKKRSCTTEVVNGGHICVLCNRSFTRADTLKRHIANKNIHTDEERLKVKKLLNSTTISDTIINADNRKIIIDGNENSIDARVDNRVINNTNTTNNNTTNNIYVTVAPYGKEDLSSYMTEDDILHFLFMGVMSIPELIKFIHFNKNKPEFHNIYISNIKSKYAKRYDGKKWNVCDKDDAIEEEYMRACDFLEGVYDEYKSKEILGELTKTKMDKFMIRKDDKDYVEKMAAKILMILYNNRDIVEETIKNNKQFENK